MFFKINNKRYSKDKIRKRRTKPPMTLVLDLDETLIHTTKSKVCDRQSGVEVRVEDRYSFFYVHKRPHVDLFLSELFPLYEIVIYTAGRQEYAEAMIGEVEIEHYIDRSLFREDCIEIDSQAARKFYEEKNALEKHPAQKQNKKIDETLRRLVEGGEGTEKNKYFIDKDENKTKQEGGKKTEEGGKGGKEDKINSCNSGAASLNCYVKDIRKIRADLSKVILIDNSLLAGSKWPENFIPINGWRGDYNDSELLDLVPLLLSIRKIRDVRLLLAFRLKTSSEILGLRVSKDRNLRRLPSPGEHTQKNYLQKICLMLKLYYLKEHFLIFINKLKSNYVRLNEECLCNFNYYITKVCKFFGFSYILRCIGCRSRADSSSSSNTSKRLLLSSSSSSSSYVHYENNGQQKTFISANNNNDNVNIPSSASFYSSSSSSSSFFSLSNVYSLFRRNVDRLSFLNFTKTTDRRVNTRSNNNNNNNNNIINSYIHRHHNLISAKFDGKFGGFYKPYAPPPNVSFSPRPKSNNLSSFSFSYSSSNTNTAPSDRRFKQNATSHSST